MEKGDRRKDTSLSGVDSLLKNGDYLNQPSWFTHYVQRVDRTVSLLQKLSFVMTWISSFPITLKAVPACQGWICTWGFILFNRPPFCTLLPICHKMLLPPSLKQPDLTLLRLLIDTSYFTCSAPSTVARPANQLWCIYSHILWIFIL